MEVRFTDDASNAETVTSDAVGPLVGVPAAPASFAAARAGSGAVTLTFAAPGDDGGSAVTGYAYRVKRGDGAFGSWTALTQAAVDNQQVALSGLVDGAEFTFELRAQNAAGTGAAAMGTAVLPSAPGAVRNLAAEPGDGEVTLTWAAPSADGGVPSALQYQRRSKAGTGAFSAWSSPATGTTVRLSSLTNEVLYTFQVACGV